MPSLCLPCSIGKRRLGSESGSWCKEIIPSSRDRIIVKTHCHQLECNRELLRENKEPCPLLNKKQAKKRPSSSSTRRRTLPGPTEDGALKWPSLKKKKKIGVPSSGKKGQEEEGKKEAAVRNVA